MKDLQLIYNVIMDAFERGATRLTKKKMVELIGKKFDDNPDYWHRICSAAIKKVRKFCWDTDKGRNSMRLFHYVRSADGLPGHYSLIGIDDNPINCLEVADVCIRAQNRVNGITMKVRQMLDSPYSSLIKNGMEQYSNLTKKRTKQRYEAGLQEELLK